MHISSVGVHLYITLLDMRAFLFTAVVAARAAADVPYIPAAHACLAPNVSQLPFCDPALSIPVRVADLLSRMTVAEKIGLLGSAPGTDSCSIIDE